MRAVCVLNAESWSLPLASPPGLTCLLNRLLMAQVCITVLSMSDLPAKYKHLRLITTRGAKAVSTKELFAVNQRCQVSRSLARALSLPFSCVCSTAC
jgi:hypothetical protein